MVLVTFSSERGHPGKSRGLALAISGFRASHWHPSLLLLLAALHLGLALDYHVKGTRRFAATPSMFLIQVHSPCFGSSEPCLGLPSHLEGRVPRVRCGHASPEAGRPRRQRIPTTRTADWHVRIQCKYTPVELPEEKHQAD